MIGFLTGALTVTVFAAPSINYYTEITSGGHRASGVTSCDIAELCQVELWGYYDGGSKYGTNSGRVATSTAVYVDSPKQFDTARSEHHIEVWESGSLNIYNRTSSATH